MEEKVRLVDDAEIQKLQAQLVVAAEETVKGLGDISQAIGERFLAEAGENEEIEIYPTACRMGMISAVLGATFAKTQTEAEQKQLLAYAFTVMEHALGIELEVIIGDPFERAEPASPVAH